MNLNRALRVQAGDVLSFVGGGGKTSIMFRLAVELTAGGQRVVTTTTTHIFAHQIGLAPHHILCQPCLPVDVLLSKVRAEISTHPHILVIGETDPETGRAAGIDPALVDRLAALPELDCVLNEADGARMRPFKAPARHEPVLPASTNKLVPVVGIEALGSRLTEEFVHRSALVAELAEVEPGVRLTPEMVARVLTHPRGGLKELPPAARVMPFINKVERHKVDSLPAARELAGALIDCPRLDAVVIGAAREDDPVGEVRGRVTAVVLAAGAGSRFGQLKQLMPWQDGTLLSRTVDTALASNADTVLVVLGNQAHACRSALGDRPVTVVTNNDWHSGQASSVRAAVKALPDGTSGLLVLLADQPRVQVSTLDALIDRYRTGLAPVTWPEYQGRRGNPVLWDRDVFPDLLRLEKDVGGRALFERHTEAAQSVSVSDPGILIDIDTPEDYRQINRD